MSPDASGYDVGHTALLQPRWQQAVLMLRRRNFPALNHCHGLRHHINQGKLGAVSKMRIQTFFL